MKFIFSNSSPALANALHLLLSTLWLAWKLSLSPLFSTAFVLHLTHISLVWRWSSGCAAKRWQDTRISLPQQQHQQQQQQLDSENPQTHQQPQQTSLIYFSSN